MSETGTDSAGGSARAEDGAAPERDAAGLPADDERNSREKVEDTGEPERDALGNADGAS